MCVNILLEAVTVIVIVLIFIGILVIKFKKNTIKKIELAIGCLLAIILLSFSIKQFIDAFSPQIETETMQLVSFKRPLHKMGSECCFKNGDETIFLYIDPFTLRRYINNDGLIIGEEYTIEYETNYNAVVKIFLENREQLGDG